jgi:hypothetical protein
VAQNRPGSSAAQSPGDPSTGTVRGSDPVSHSR